MRNKALLAFVAMLLAVMLPLMAAADEPQPLVIGVSGAGYFELVTEYGWDVTATATSGGEPLTSVDLMAGGQKILNYKLSVEREAADSAFVYGLRGIAVVENNTGAELTGLEIVFSLSYQSGESGWVQSGQQLTVPFSVTDDATVPFDFVVDITEYSAIPQEDLRFKVEAAVVLDDETFAGEADGLEMPATHTVVDLNRTAIVDVDLVWLQSGNHVAMPAGVSLLTYPSIQSWVLDSAELTEGKAERELLALIDTGSFAAAAGTHNYMLRLDIRIVPANDEAQYADSLALPLNITVPTAGNHSVHFYAPWGHGTVSARLGDSEIINGAVIASGSNITFRAVPDTGYTVREWRVNGVVQPGTGTSLTVAGLAANTVVTVEFAPLTLGMTDYEMDETPAAAAVANVILKAHGIPHRIATQATHRNGKPIYINLISEVARQQRGNTFMGVDRSNQAAYQTAVYNYLKQLGAQLP